MTIVKAARTELYDKAKRKKLLFKICLQLRAKSMFNV